VQDHHSYSFSIGISRACAHLQDLRRFYHEALLASVHCPGSSCFYEDLLKEQGEQTVRFQSQKQLFQALKNGDWEEIEGKLRQLVALDEQQRTPMLQAQQYSFGHLMMIANYLEEMGILIEPSLLSLQSGTYAELHQEISCKLRMIAKMVTEAKNRFDTEAVYRVKQYIEQHFTQDLSLEHLAELVQLSPWYISKCFKEKFQISYIDYLTHCRIEYAKQLILQGEKSIKEIAFEVGYHDPNYFSRVFKKVCGCSPSSYNVKSESISMR
jgi:two-component system response regulator YesN